MTALDAALDYHGRGFALLPLRPRDKRPHGEVLNETYGSPAWGPLQRRRASVAEIAEWFQTDPEANLGVITGEPSGIAVADFDRPPAGVHHPPTPSATTSRGYHVYLRSDGPVRSEKYRWGELRGDGGYVVAPPSLHPSGHRYEWMLGPDDVSFASLAELVLDREQKSSRPAEVSPGSSYRLPGDTSASSDEQHGRLACDAAAVVAACRALGIQAPPGKPFPCILPGHAERRPSASLCKDPRTGVWKYHDFHRRGPEWLTLADVRAAHAYGRVVDLQGPAAARWYLRLFHEAGYIAPKPVPMPPALARPPSVRRVADGFRLLLGLRWLADPGAATPFTREFAAAWCGVSWRTAGNAIAALRDLDVIRKVDEHRAGGRSMNLYLPGEGRRRCCSRVTAPEAS